jgi:flagellin
MISIGEAVGPSYSTLSLTDAADITQIDNAINAISAQRATLGGIQNRLEHSLSAAGAYQENLVAAESRIRDVDMASEMVEYTKYSILAQAGQAMLAQANQAPASVLSLLQ